jgi:hypothetical protein
MSGRFANEAGCVVVSRKLLQRVRTGWFPRPRSALSLALASGSSPPGGGALDLLPPCPDGRGLGAGRWVGDGRPVVGRLRKVDEGYPC